MTKRWPCVVVTMLCCLLTVATSAATECAWVLWVEQPGGSDHWSIASIPGPRFKVKEECQRRAQDLNDLELTFSKMESAEAHDLFSCLPDTVDPRPEGALLHDTIDPRGPKRK
jgi:hypothetical protein